MFKNSLLIALSVLYAFSGKSQSLPSPVFDSVTVNSAGHAFLTWGVSPDPSTTGYFIYEYINNQNLNPVSISGRLNNTYTFPTNKASMASQSFTIAAYSATDTSLINEAYHRTIFLTSVLDTCQSAAQLNWNTYLNWPDGVNRYQVLVYDGTSTSIVYEGANTAYTHTGLLSGITYTYHVRAISGNGTRSSVSNAVTATGNFKKAPDFVYLASVSVPVSGSVDLRWITDSASTAGGITYKVLLSTDNVNFSEAQQMTLPYQRNNSTTLTGLSTGSVIYYLQISAETQCPNRIVTTDVPHTILVSAAREEESIVQLSWNPYQFWDQGVGAYEIYRTIGGTTLLLASITGTSYTDNDPVIQSTEETICYYIKAIENGVNSYGVQETSFSDQVCVTKEARIFVPDAFTPDGNNPVFRPLILSGEPPTYRLSIYNRFGNLVFSTEGDLLKGWDGNGSPAGVYVYRITVTGKDGKPYESTGTVALIR